MIIREKYKYPRQTYLRPEERLVTKRGSIGEGRRWAPSDITGGWSNIRVIIVQGKRTHIQKDES